ncbi:hypothetical protein PAMP_002057 [Pampus punctatissimus]
MGPLAVTQLLLALISLTVALDNGLMKTPPMGWMAWERFRCNVDCKDDPENCISEGLFRDMADRLAEDGWKELGYEYVIIDDCWMSRLRDEQGRLQPEPSRFPGGIAKLARYIHDRGLKLGIYADMGNYTCMGFPGTTLDKIEIDAQTFASWEVNYSLLGDICHLWRNYNDIQDSWDSVQGIIEWFSNNQDDLQPAAGPGRWNDPDMLIIGNFGLSLDQARAQMAVWAIMAAPLIMSNDLRNLDNSARAILQNKAVIAINQDPMGIQGRRLLQEKSHIEVYWRPLVHSASALVFLSRRTDMPYLYHTSLAKLNYDAGNYEAYDVFTGSTMKGLNTTTELTLSINPSGVVMWYIYPEQRYKEATETLRQQHMKASFTFHKAEPEHHTVL